MRVKQLVVLFFQFSKSPCSSDEAACSLCPSLLAGAVRSSDGVLLEWGTLGRLAGSEGRRVGSDLVVGEEVLGGGGVLLVVVVV